MAGTVARLTAAAILVFSISAPRVAAGVYSGAFQSVQVGYFGCLQGVPADGGVLTCIAAYRSAEGVEVLVAGRGRDRYIAGERIQETYVERALLPAGVLQVVAVPSRGTLGVELKFELPRTGLIELTSTAPSPNYFVGALPARCELSLHYSLAGDDVKEVIGYRTIDRGSIGGASVMEYDTQCNAYFIDETSGIWQFVEALEEGTLP